MKEKLMLWGIDNEVDFRTLTDDSHSKHTSGQIIAGCDEAGRGCIAGPVVAAAVILSNNCVIEGLNDSKQLTSHQREKLRPEIQTKSLAWAVGFASNHEIDRLNILKATFLAMHRAVSNLRINPDLLLVDGNRFQNFSETPHRCIIKGDATVAQISAASVLAKTYRDDLMKSLHCYYPNFLWDRNKGYPTRQHLLAIRTHGTSSWHRKTFTPCFCYELPFDESNY